MGKTSVSLCMRFSIGKRTAIRVRACCYEAQLREIPLFKALSLSCEAEVLSKLKKYEEYNKK